MEQKQFNLAISLALIALIIVPLAAFWPGTSGDFLLDDYGSLTGLKALESDYNINTVSQYIFSGNTSPTGRPLSLFTFTLDGNTWPTDATPFKKTNIFLHILNGLVLFSLAFLVCRILNRSKASALTISFITSIVWLLHPLQTSTVLYVVQRMTELSTLFILMGALCYIIGRRQLISSPGVAYLIMSAGVVLFGALAVLSKENGALLPLLILITEFTLLNNLQRPRHWYYWGVPLLVIPNILLIGYLIYVSNDPAAYTTRTFTLYERTLTQGRVIFDYIANIILPVDTPSLHHDDFILSKGLFTPVSTFFFTNFYYRISLICAHLQENNAYNQFCCFMVSGCTCFGINRASLRDLF